jgi:hypothetical protein
MQKNLAKRSGQGDIHKFEVLGRESVIEKDWGALNGKCINSYS